MNDVPVLDASSVFDPPGYRCRLEWGRRGARRAAERGDTLVVVDVLCFSTAVAAAISRGATIYPCAKQDEAGALAARVGAEVAVHRRDVPRYGRFSLSPLTFEAAEAGARIVLASPNGATCSRYGQSVPHLFVGALVNARAVAAAVTQVLDGDPRHCVSVLACGERWQEASEDGDLRFAVEDYLGAGAILSHLPGRVSRSPEALVCEAAFGGAAAQLAAVLAGCGSGRELQARDYGRDVEFAARLNVYDAVPVLVNGEKIVREMA